MASFTEIINNATGKQVINPNPNPLPIPIKTNDPNTGKPITLPPNQSVSKPTPGGYSSGSSGNRSAQQSTNIFQSNTPAPMSTPNNPIQNAIAEQHYGLSLARQSENAQRDAKQRDAGFAIMSNQQPPNKQDPLGFNQFMDKSVYPKLNSGVATGLNFFSNSFLDAPRLTYTDKGFGKTSGKDFSGISIIPNINKEGAFELLPLNTTVSASATGIFMMASSGPFFETGAQSFKPLANAGFKANTATGFISPVEKINFFSPLKNLGDVKPFSITPPIREISGETTTFFDINALRYAGNSKSTIHYPSLEVTPTSDTSQSYFIPRSTTNINTKGLSGTSFSMSKPSGGSFGDINDITKKPLTLDYGNGNSKTSEAYTGKISGTTNLYVNTKPTYFDSLGVVKEGKDFDTILNLKYDPKITKGSSSSYSSERFIPVAGKDYSPMKISYESKSGVSFDFTNLKFGGVGIAPKSSIRYFDLNNNLGYGPMPKIEPGPMSVPNKIEPGPMSVPNKIEPGPMSKPTYTSSEALQDAYNKELLGPTGRSYSQVDTGYSQLGLTNPSLSSKTNLGLAALNDISTRNFLSALDDLKLSNKFTGPNGLPSTFSLGGKSLNSGAGNNGLGNPSLFFDQFNKNNNPNNPFKFGIGSKNQDMSKLDSGFKLGFGSGNNFMSVPHPPIPNQNQPPIDVITSKTLITYGQSFGYSNPKIKTPNEPIPIISDFTFEPPRKDIGLALPELPSLGGYFLENPRKKGRKQNIFDISPSFTAIIEDIKMKSPLKVSKTFGVTPFQTRGILTGKALKGSYFKLIDF